MDPRPASPPDEGFLPALIGDGRPLLALAGLALILAGVVALFLSITESFLPQDIAFLGMDTSALCGLSQGRVARFMFHDRTAFGGTLLAIGTLYLWLEQFPLRRGEEWAWWTFVVSGGAGFASFLCYLGYGYLDTWHGVATLGLLPLFLGGLWQTHFQLAAPRRGWRSLLVPGVPPEWRTRAGFGRCLLLLTGLGMTGAGSVIMLVGMTVIFVPEDLSYIGLRAAQLHALNPHLLPLIAHDRAGFGGGLASCGLTVFLIVWKAPRLSPDLWQALGLAGLAGFGCAIGVHYRIGYLIITHLAPAWAGALLYLAGMVCARPANGR